MEHPGERTSILVLGPADTGRRGDAVGASQPRQPDRRPGPQPPRAADDAHAEAAAGTSGFRSPGLALLAAASILEGYRFLGVIQGGGSRASALASGRPGALLFALGALLGASALTRAASRRRSLVQGAVVVAALSVLAATSLVEVAGGTTARSLLGITDLALALAAIAAVIVGERRKQQPSPHHADQWKKPVGPTRNSGTPG
jgi:hypothetical protein